MKSQFCNNPLVMLSFQQAREIAETKIKNYHHRSGDELIIVDTHNIEMPYALIFPYTSKRWFVEGDIQYAIVGNGPLFVDKRNGRISNFPTGLNMEGMIDAYEEENKSWSLKIPTDTYSDVAKLLTLKHILNRTQKEIREMRANNTETVGMGARSRLTILNDQLNTNGISSQIELTPSNTNAE